MAHTATAHTVKGADQYDDPSYNYLRYWDGRDYEHAAEEMAIRRLLHGKHFGVAMDVGGGYGRLCLLLEKYADNVILAEPSQQQLDLSEEFLKGHKEVKRLLAQANDLQKPDGSVDLVTLVRVMHHLPDPSAELAEIARVLSPDGYAIIEMANYAHMRNRIKHLLRGKQLPLKPVDIRSTKNRTSGEVAFVNHNPHTVVRQLEHAGLYVERTLSVSNLRSQKLKRLLPHRAMVGIERALQAPLAALYFGPSIFFLVRKAR
ncbi:MAG TPA: class I SAM-dependent methyltransferase [Candidatus Saccharimonadales bacterium]|nr:class I SAM-dependent methyltransferase [Candidatus Saccharimonadales bacterium]